MGDDVKNIDDAITDQIAGEEVFNSKPDRRLFTHAHLKPLMLKFQSMQGHSSRSLESSLPTPVAGGLIMIPLLIAAVAVSGRLPTQHLIQVLSERLVEWAIRGPYQAA